MSSPVNLPPGLPTQTSSVLFDFVNAARTILGDDLHSAVLFGSAAEGRLRQQSDVNLILVLSRFDPAKAAGLSNFLTLARAAIDLQVMFLAESEIEAALDCFAQKFADILRRHHVIYGPDPFAKRAISRDEEIRRTRQSLLNLTLRLRERYTLLSTHPDRIATAIADAIGPLRSCAAAIREIEGHADTSPKDAFAALIAALGQAEWNYLPPYFSAVRESATPATPAAPDVIAHLLALATIMRLRLESHL